MDPETTVDQNLNIPEKAKTFSQEEVNALMGRTRSEERQKYADYDELKTEAEEGRKLKLESMSEAERLQARLAEAERKGIDTDERIASTMIQSAIRVSAMQKGIVDPDAAVALIDRSSIAYADDAGVTGVAEALDVLLETKPYLKAQAINPNLNPGGGSPAPPEKTLTADQRDAAKKLGLPEEDYSKGILAT